MFFEILSFNIPEFIRGKQFNEFYIKLVFSIFIPRLLHVYIMMHVLSQTSFMKSPPAPYILRRTVIVVSIGDTHNTIYSTHFFHRYTPRGTSISMPHNNLTHHLPQEPSQILSIASTQWHLIWVRHVITSHVDSIVLIDTCKIVQREPCLSKTLLMQL